MTDATPANPIMSFKEHDIVVQETSCLIPYGSCQDPHENPANDQTDESRGVHTTKKNCVFSIPCLSITTQATTALAVCTSIGGDLLKDNYHLALSLTSHCAGAGAYLTNTAHSTKKFDAIEKKVDGLHKKSGIMSKEIGSISTRMGKMEKKMDDVAEEVTEKVDGMTGKVDGITEKVDDLTTKVDCNTAITGTLARESSATGLNVLFLRLGQLENKLMMKKIYHVIGEADLSPEVKQQQVQEIQEAIKIVQTEITKATQGD